MRLAVGRDSCHGPSTTSLSFLFPVSFPSRPSLTSMSLMSKRQESEAVIAASPWNYRQMNGAHRTRRLRHDTQWPRIPSRYGRPETASRPGRGSWLLGARSQGPRPTCCPPSRMLQRCNSRGRHLAHAQLRTITPVTVCHSCAIRLPFQGVSELDLPRIRWHQGVKVEPRYRCFLRCAAAQA